MASNQNVKNSKGMASVPFLQKEQADLLDSALQFYMAQVINHLPNSSVIREQWLAVWNTCGKLRTPDTGAI